MIFTPFLYILRAVIWLILLPIRLIPDATLPVDVASSFAMTGHYLSNLNQLFPLITMALTLGSMVIVESAIGVWKGIQWLIKKIPTIN
jgi:hypothetical protein